MVNSNETILITGGAGFIGRHLAQRLVADGYAVRALDNLSPQVHRNPAESQAAFPGDVLIGDIRSRDDIERAIRRCVAVVHLAAETGVGQSMYEVDKYQSVNVNGTQQVVDAASRLGLPVLIASSRAVYGIGAFDCVNHGRTSGSVCCERATPAKSRESDEIAPVSVYGETKATGEQIAAAAATRAIAIRPQNVIGPGQALHNPYTGVLAAFAARLRAGLPPQVYGDGLQTRDFIDVRDVCATITYLLNHTNRWAEFPTINVGSGIRHSLLDLARVSSAVAGVETQPEHVQVTRAGDIDHACADVDSATKLGLPAPEISFEESIRTFLEFAFDEEPVDPQIWATALDELSDTTKA